MSEILLIKEIRNQSKSLHGREVRATGRIKHFRAVENCVIIEDEGCQLAVDVEFLGVIPFRIGALYSFFGEVRCKQEDDGEGDKEEEEEEEEVKDAKGRQHTARGTVDVKLHARIGKNMDKLDFVVFKRALELRRRFLSASSSSESGTVTGATGSAL